jgi:DNA-binding beta-propeller fold protein YncE
MAIWKLDAITTVDDGIIALQTWSLFIDRDDILHVRIAGSIHLQRWMTLPVGALANASTTSINGTSVFVAYNGDMFVDRCNASSCLIENRINTSNSDWNTVMITDGPCHGLVVSIYNDVYCSISHLHIVQRRRSIDPSNVTTNIGTMLTSGVAANQLHNPRGIYVTRDLDLYVADCGNDRVQLFRFNQTSATLSFNASGTIALNCPTSVALDANDSLYIVDSRNHRIVRHRHGSFQCIVGCTGSPGSTAEHLSEPSTLALDSRGNLYVLDAGNRRVQQFLLENASYGKSIVTLRSEHH